LEDLGLGQSRGQVVQQYYSGKVTVAIDDGKGVASGRDQALERFVNPVADMPGGGP